MLYQKEINTREIDPFEYLRKTSCSRVGACCNSVFFVFVSNHYRSGLAENLGINPVFLKVVP